MFRSLFLLVLLLPGLSAAAQVVGYVDSVEVHRTDTIYFDFGSSELTKEARRAVKNLVADRPGELELYLEGHTDAVGSDAANDRLARRRSETVLNAALSSGWPEAAIEIRHFGEQRLEVNTNQREWRNRRVLLRSGLPKRYARFRGRITDPEGRPLGGVAIARSRYLKDSVKTNENGFYELMLPLDIGVRLDIYAKDHFFDSEIIVLSESKPSSSPLVSKLRPATVGSKMAVDDLYFVGNETNLLKESFPALPRLLLFMRSSPDLQIEIAGHVNRPGGPEGPGSWSFNLAHNRAKTIYEFLVEFGIDPGRMTYKGYSNWEMINPNARTEMEMRENRRVEIRVTGVEIEH
ncbi:OmpA family protein [Neolewinella persica]|uniref:OmpA family protein n=1 Tax=Neolewinella persica TaxID=70998 RepID=UPI0003700FFD|nr:OmpA family protein [Neolewinella persica]